MTDLLLQLRTAEAALSRARALVVDPGAATCACGGETVVSADALAQALRRPR